LKNQNRGAEPLHEINPEGWVVTYILQTDGRYRLIAAHSEKTGVDADSYAREIILGLDEHHGLDACSLHIQAFEDIPLYLDKNQNPLLIYFEFTAQDNCCHTVQIKAVSLATAAHTLLGVEGDKPYKTVPGVPKDKPGTQKGWFIHRAGFKKLPMEEEFRKQKE
jgi:hypothetical protein